MYLSVKGKEGEVEPDWVTSERDQFHKLRDKDEDGFLNFQEVHPLFIYLTIYL